MIESDYLGPRADVIDNLRSLSAFKGLPEELLGELLNLTRLRKYEAGETIFDPATDGGFMFIMLNGHVTLSRDGAEVAVCRRAGDFLGEPGALEGQSGDLTCVTVLPTLALAVDLNGLKRLEGDRRSELHALLYRCIAQMLASRLSLAERRLAQAQATISRLETTLTVAGLRPQNKP